MLKRTTMLMVMTLAVGGAAAKPAFGQATVFKINTSLPVHLTVFVSCANGGAGEWVTLGGEQHILFHGTSTEQGRHSKVQFQYAGVTGTGTVTGDKYQGTGAAHSTFTSSDPGADLVFSFGNNFGVIGQGTGNNFKLHQTFHITFTAQGEFTASVSASRVECK